jgi:hypothetical protein
MSSIPANVIMVWPSTNASIPSGWSRETTLDSKFAKAWGAENPDTTGGADTHTHTSATHTHSITSHTHTGTTASDGAVASQKDTSAVGGANESGHTHTFTSGGISANSAASSAITWSSPSNDPPYRKVIFIKASTGAQLATDMVALFNSNTPPSNWSNVTELQGRFLKGAGTSADADLTTDNGTSTHTHTSSHNHAISHNHTGTTDGNSANTRGVTAGGANNASNINHTHTFTLSTANETSDTYNATTANGDNVPEYALLQAIKKGATGIKTKGIIGLWLGTTATIPKGWVLCDGTNSTKDLRDKFIKIGDPSGANGGANTNSHTTITHGHNATGTHTHTATTDANGTANYYANSGTTHGNNAHTHSISTTSSQTTALTNGDIPATSTDSNQPAYRTAAYIEFQKENNGGAFLNLLIN